MNVKVLNVGFKFQLSINVVYLNYILVEIKVSKILEKNVLKDYPEISINSHHPDLLILPVFGFSR